MVSITEMDSLPIISTGKGRIFFFLRVNNSPLEIKGSDRAKELLIFDNQWVLSLFCFRTAGTGKAMKLGSKSKDVDSFVDKLRSEGTGEERSTTK